MFHLNHGTFKETECEGQLLLQPASTALVRGLTALGVRLTLDLTLSLLHSASRPDQSDVSLTQAGGHGRPPRVCGGGGFGGSAVRRRQLRALSVACLGGADALGPAMAESAQAALFQTFRRPPAACPACFRCMLSGSFLLHARCILSFMVAVGLQSRLLPTSLMSSLHPQPQDANGSYHT